MAVITDHPTARTARTALDGELDVASVGRAVETLLSASSRCEVLEVDLSGVTFIDPCGVRALMVGQLAMRNIGGRISFVSARPSVARVLRLVGIDLT